MTKTLVTDDFAYDASDIKSNSVPYEPHNILYGSKGWTDSIDDVTIETLLRTGAIVCDRTVTGVGFETRIYVSIQGNKP